MSFLDGDIELGDVAAGQTLAAGGHAARHTEVKDALEEIRDGWPTKADQADLDAALVGEGNVPVPTAAGEVLKATGTSLGDHEWDSLSAAEVTYDGSASGIAATDASGAIDEIVTVREGLYPLTAEPGFDRTGATDSSAALQAADDRVAAATAAGYKQLGLMLPASRIKLAAPVTKSPFTSWIGPAASGKLGTAGAEYATSLEVAHNGDVITVVNPGGTSVYAADAEIRNLSILGSTSYPDARGIVWEPGIRQQVVSNVRPIYLATAFAGTAAEMTFERCFALQCKYSWLMTLNDSWFVECHGGAGPATPTEFQGGTGFYLQSSRNVWLTNCRPQVQKAGNGAIFENIEGLHLIAPVIDQNEAHGVRFINVSRASVAAADAFDNGVTGAQSAGFQISSEARTVSSVDIGSDSLSFTLHRYFTGQKVHLASSGSLPTGLTPATDYYVIKVSTTQIKLATTYANAAAGTAIDLTSAGSGTITVVGVSEGITFSGGRFRDRNKGGAAARQNRGITFARADASGVIRDVTLMGVDFSGVGVPIENETYVTRLEIHGCPGRGGRSAGQTDRYRDVGVEAIATARTLGDTGPRWRQLANGTQEFGDGAGSNDVQWGRRAIDQIGAGVGDSIRLDMTWNGGHIVRENGVHIWIDDTYTWRYKGVAPSSHNDGTAFP